MTNRAQTIIAKIDEMFTEDESDVQLLEGSLPNNSRFSLRMYHPQTQKLLFKAHANSRSQIKSLLSNAAKHLKTGGMDKVRISVQDHKHGMNSDHKLSILPNGNVHTSGPDVENHFED